MTPWERLLATPHAGGHFVQLYHSGDAGLVGNVGHYLWEGLKRGEGVLLVSTAEHQAQFVRYLEHRGADLATLLESGRLVSRDAEHTLARLTVDGHPDWRLFEKEICAAVRDVHPADGVHGLRAYGEMVGILWQARRFAAAIRLEQLWNRLLEQSSFSLYCAYQVDLFAQECDVANLEHVLCTHTHLIPADSDGKLEAAVQRSMDEVLGPRAEEIRARIKANYRAAWAVMPTAENTLLWLRRYLPDGADRIVSLARQYYLRESHSRQAA